MASGNQDNKSSSAENKSLTSEASPTDSNQQQAGSRRTNSTPATGFPMNPFDFSAMQNLLNDPTIKDMAEQIAKDPVFNQMAEQLQKSVHSTGQDSVPPLDPQQYISTMQQVMENPQFMKMAEQLGNAIMQDPGMSSMLENLTNPAQKEQIEERMARMKDDPSLKGILEEIETGGPSAMMKYWNDSDVLQKLGQAMGVGPSGDGTSTTDLSATEEAEEEGGYEDESIVHHTASVGDIERPVYIFDSNSQEVPAASSDVLVNAFSQGLTEGDFFRSIIKRPPENFDVLLSRADKYIHVEEAQAARRREAEPGHGSASHRNAPPAPRADRKSAPQLLHRSDLDRNSTPTKHHQRTIHEVANQPSPPGRNSRWAPKFCAYHQSRSHDTNECHQYAKELRLAADQRTQKSPHQRQGRPASATGRANQSQSYDISA
ncbi:uncharacterized protein LOC141821636 [Curcuma longa]|uniref:uncharacterized protein LOC141821636 n=1 Tax=Curcuma longa TaxID=136217 RepID=UPI003D9E5C26